MTSLVPTPSVDEASTGSRYCPSRSRNRPAKPPMSPSTSGRRGLLRVRPEQLDGPLARVESTPAAA